MPPKEPELRDIHVPHVSEWWPLAPGWWVLIALVVVAIVIGLVLWFRRRAWRRRVDTVLVELHDARDRHARDGDTAAFAAVASQLLRRVARTRDARSVTLTGDAWRDLLAHYAPRVSTEHLAGLDAALYRPRGDLDVLATARDTEAWIRAALRPQAKGRATHAAA